MHSDLTRTLAVHWKSAFQFLHSHFLSCFCQLQSLFTLTTGSPYWWIPDTTDHCDRKSMYFSPLELSCSHTMDLNCLFWGGKHWFGSKTQRDDDWNGTEHKLGLHLGQTFWKQHKIKIQEHISRFAQSTLETCSAVTNRLRVDINLMCHWPGNKKVLLNEIDWFNL